MIFLELLITGCGEMDKHETQVNYTDIPDISDVNKEKTLQNTTEYNSEGMYSNEEIKQRLGINDIEFKKIEEGIKQISKILTLESTRKQWIDHDDIIRKLIGSTGDLIDNYSLVKNKSEGENMNMLDKIIEYYHYEDTNHFFPYANQDVTFPNEDDVLIYKSKRSFEELTLDEFLDLASKLYIDDEGNDPYILLDQQEWKSEKDYILLSGRQHWTKFLIIYDKKGQYVTGHTWSDKVYNRPIPSYYEKQKAYGVGTMCFNHGTGVACYGNRLFQVYKDKLVNIFDYPTHGDMLLSGNNLWLQYDVEENDYEPETGNISIIYTVSILDGQQKVFDTQTKVTYTWLEEKECFNMPNEGFYEILYNELIYPSVIEGLHKDDMKSLNYILKCNKEAKEELLYFLDKAPDSNQKDALIEVLERQSI
jgi:hypothetical protein